MVLLVLGFFFASPINKKVDWISVIENFKFYFHDKYLDNRQLGSQYVALLILNLKINFFFFLDTLK
jgi:hypothetical protein